MRRILAVVLALFAIVPPALAQDYPTRTITLVTPFPPGGPSDTTARMIVGAMSKALGQTIVVENVPGADCVIGAWRGVSGPAGLAPSQINFWAEIVGPATRHPAWQAELARLSWSPLVQTGDVLRAYLAQERAEFVATLSELGLLKAA